MRVSVAIETWPRARARNTTSPHACSLSPPAAPARQRARGAPGPGTQTSSGPLECRWRPRTGTGARRVLHHTGSAARRSGGVLLRRGARASNGRRPARCRHPAACRPRLRGPGRTCAGRAVMNAGRCACWAASLHRRGRSSNGAHDSCGLHGQVRPLARRRHVQPLRRPPLRKRAAGLVPPGAPVAILVASGRSTSWWQYCCHAELKPALKGTSAAIRQLRVRPLPSRSDRPKLGRALRPIQAV